MSEAPAVDTELGQACHRRMAGGGEARYRPEPFLHYSDRDRRRGQWKNPACPTSKGRLTLSASERRALRDRANQQRTSDADAGRTGGERDRRRGQLFAGYGRTPLSTMKCSTLPARRAPLPRAVGSLATTATGCDHAGAGRAVVLHEASLFRQWRGRGAGAIHPIDIHPAADRGRRMGFLERGPAPAAQR